MTRPALKLAASTSAPPAPYPETTQAKGWRLELDLQALYLSKGWVLAQPADRPWLLMLMAVSWAQVPCGSLPNDDELLAALIGMPAREFLAHRDALMRGWWLADDGRLYCDAVVDAVHGMQASRAKQANKVANWRKKKTESRGGVSPQKSPQAAPNPPCLAPDSQPTFPPLDHDFPGVEGGEFDGVVTGYTQATNPEVTTLELELELSPSLHSGETRAPEVDFGEDDPVVDGGHAVVAGQAGAVCRALKARGIPDVNPGNGRLLDLLRDGVPLDQFEAAADAAVNRGKTSFAYVLGTLRGWVDDEARGKTAAAPKPPAAKVPALGEVKRDYGKGGRL